MRKQTSDEHSRADKWGEERKEVYVYRMYFAAINGALNYLHYSITVCSFIPGV